jgi:hypothetical protein
MKNKNSVKRTTLNKETLTKLQPRLGREQLAGVRGGRVGCNIWTDKLSSCSPTCH